MIQRSIQDTEINAKNSEKKYNHLKQSVPSTCKLCRFYHVDENVCIPLGSIKGYNKTLP